ncbi:MAG TPA: NADP-dependent oxidoreductase [Solirubrobacteraceae bacterium]|nr:NADP-dependent oxidoreductase [Solirubrobacteraceae bacterium]
MAAASTMRVCEVTEFGGPEVLREAQRPWPRAATGEIVVEIAATNINPTDIAARTGAHRRRMPDLEPPFVTGWDLAGVVSEVNAGDGAFNVGDRVVGMIPWARIGGRVGAYAQAAAVDPAWLAHRPDGLDDIQGATVPLNSLTAHQALELIGAPTGATLLITGASGAVGGFATQLAVQRGLRVLAVASDADEDWVASLGPDQVLARDTDLADVGPVDALLDAVPIGAAAIAPVRAGGVALFTRGSVELPDGLDLRVEMPLVDSDPAALAQLTAQVADGSLKSRVAMTLDLSEAAEGHRLVERGGLRGKVVLTTR